MRKDVKMPANIDEQTLIYRRKDKKTKIKEQRKEKGNNAEKLPKVKPGRFVNPREGSKKTSREDEAKSSKIEVKAGGSSGLPLAMYIDLMAYLT